MPKLSPARWRAILSALIAAAVVGLGLGTVSIDGTSSPSSPTSTPAPSSPAIAPHALARPDASPAPALAGTDHTGLNQPGDTQPHGFRPFTAAAPLPGCSSRFNTSNFSSRNGAAVRELVAHYTVSRNVPGWADVNANVAFLNRPATLASAGAIIDAEGHCAYTVPVALKSWTQANANPFSFGVEFVDQGDEGKLSAAALKEGGRVFAAVAKLEHIPVQLGDVTNCQPVRAGIVDHGMLGACGGGHHDLRPFYGSSVVPRSSDDAKVLAPLIAATRSAASASSAAGRRRAAALSCLEHERRIAKRHGGWSKVAPSHLARARACKARLV